MVAPLACAMGVPLLAWALPIPLSFPALATPTLLACAIQFYDLYRRRSGRAGRLPQRRSAGETRDWRQWAVAVAGLGPLLALFSPFGSPPDAAHRRRLTVLTAPTLSFSPARNFYLTGAPGHWSCWRRRNRSSLASLSWRGATPREGRSTPGAW